MVEYLLGDSRSLVWVVTRSNLASSVLAGRKEIEDQVVAYRKLLSERASVLTQRNSQGEINRLGAKLYRTIVQPFEKDLTSVRTLIVVPDGVLDYLPFEALIAATPRQAAGDGQPVYLIEKFAVVYGPSASALATVQELNRKTTAPSKMLLAFGDPVVALSSNPSPSTPGDVVSRSASETPDMTSPQDYAERGFSFSRLPFTREEVLAISKLFPASQRRIYLGEEAREEAVKAEKLDDYRYLHFASHGFLDEAKPGRSGILLSSPAGSSEDGVLQMDEIMRLKMNADLVTLSACSTGLGKLVNGEGLLSLTRAFFYAGARNVTVSLWNVNDSATSSLMKSYYENLNRGASQRVALRLAKLTMLRGKNALWRHPYFWAPFVLVGEGQEQTPTPPD